MDLSLKMSVNENYAYEIVKKLAFPRLIGSEGEKKAIDIVVEEFGNAGYDSIHREKFKTSFFNWIMSRYVFIPLGFFLILLAISFYINPWISLGLSILDFIVFNRALNFTTTEKIRLFSKDAKNFETENIYTTLKSKNSKAKVVFMGHWDSKSQTFPSAVRIIIIMVAVFGNLIMLILYFVLSIIRIIVPFNILLLNHILLFICICIVILGALNFFNKTGNVSPGAFDNASAVGTVIELARYFKENPTDNVDFIFLTPSSEELNLGGAKDFMFKHKDEFDKNSTYFINYDLIGGSELIRIITSYGIPRKISSKKLNDLFLASAKELGIEAKSVYLPTGAWSDYMPVVKQGFEACWIGSQPGLKYVHTKKDNMSLVSKEGLKNTLLLSIEVVNKLNGEFN